MGCKYRADVAIEIYRKKNAKIDKQKFIKKEDANCGVMKAHECEVDCGCAKERAVNMFYARAMRTWLKKVMFYEVNGKRGERKTRTN